MLKNSDKIRLLRILTIGWISGLLAGCIPSLQADSELTLPYEGTVSTSGRAFAIANTGSGSGITGATFGENDAGIEGRANNSGDITNYGGLFRSMGKKGQAVRGEALNFAGTNYGGYFITNGLKGTGVYGEASARTEERNYGGYFKAAGHKGEGVHSEASGRNGIGVFGMARSTEYAINYGGYFWAVGGVGRGVYGKTTGKAGWGVSGVASGEAGRGVFGEALDEGEVKNYGGYFVAQGKYGRGIYARGGTEGYAAEFKGTITTEVLEIKGGTDISERFAFREKEGLSPVAGMVVSIDAKSPGKLVISQKSYDRAVAGIISGAGNISPGMILQKSDSVGEREYIVALTGRVYCLADVSNGPIQPGDLLTTSETPGHAMKVTDYTNAQGAILGKAMSSLESGHGLVLVLVSLQ